MKNVIAVMLVLTVWASQPAAQPVKCGVAPRNAYAGGPKGPAPGTEEYAIFHRAMGLWHRTPHLEREAWLIPWRSHPSPGEFLVALAQYATSRDGRLGDSPEAVARRWTVYVILRDDFVRHSGRAWNPELDLVVRWNLKLISREQLQAERLATVLRSAPPC